uniref:Rec21/ENK19 domain-containing protein n=1 Tax=Oryctolagus cuniculus TaxID=9986 RepID=A0A5F9DKX5_RABIT
MAQVLGPTLRPRQAHPPTWGQLKKLNQEADKILVRMGKPKTAVTMCLAMLAVVEMNCSCVSTGLLLLIIIKIPFMFSEADRLSGFLLNYIGNGNRRLFYIQLKKCLQNYCIELRE